MSFAFYVMSIYASNVTTNARAEQQPKKYIILHLDQWLIVITNSSSLRT